MIDFEKELWQQSSVNEAMLRHYMSLDTESRRTSKEYDGWFYRVDDLPEVTSEELSMAHGHLIALGFLKVEIGGRTEGISYQITSAGKRQLELQDGGVDMSFADDESQESPSMASSSHQHPDDESSE